MCVFVKAPRSKIGVAKPVATSRIQSKLTPSSKIQSKQSTTRTNASAGSKGGSSNKVSSAALEAKDEEIQKLLAEVSLKAG